MSGPAQYLFPEHSRNLRLNGNTSNEQKVILGGGQVFGFAKTLEPTRTQSLVAWGIGLPPRGARDDEVYETAKRFSFFGTRNADWADVFEFVPCASCLSEEFDSAPSPSHELVVYSHRRKTPELQASADLPFLTNHTRDPRRAIRFIASGETVVTSSYHGVYWAQLLGRKVVCIPYNSKFYTFEHPPLFSSLENWKKDVAKATACRSLLEEYRELNIRFSDKVIDQWKM
jgi:hypothetical protein